MREANKKNWSEEERLFDQYLKNPSDTLLALEIKTIADPVADSIEHRTGKRRIRL